MKCLILPMMENAMQITFHIILQIPIKTEQDLMNVLIASITEKSVVFLWVTARNIYKGYRGPGMNKYSNTDIYQQITRLSKKDREWQKCRYLFWKFGLFMLIFIVLLWLMNKL